MKITYPPSTRALFNFLENRRVENNDYTHLSMYYPYGKFKIQDADKREFIKLYSQALSDKSKYLSLLETHLEYQPVIIDIDFKYKSKKNKRYYTEEDVKKIIMEYNKVIKEYLDVENTDIRAFLFEKDNPTMKNNIYKDGFHIIYPDIVCSTKFQHIMRHKIVEYFKNKNNLFLKVKCENSIDQIIDESVISRSSWMMFGSRKSPTHDVYKLSSVYDYEANKLDLIRIKKRLEKRNNLVVYFSIHKDENDKVYYNDNYSDEIIDKEYELLNPRPKSDKNKIENNNNIDNMRKARILVNMLSDIRAEEYTKWIELGWCLKTIDERLFETWVNFSMKCSNKFNLEECKKHWDKARDITDSRPVLTLGSLNMWAKQDNPDEYYKFQQEELKSYIERSIKGTHYDIACVVHKKYEFQFRCASIKHNLWYEFRDHRWYPDDNGTGLYIRLSDEVASDYIIQAGKMGEKLFELIGDDKDEKMKDISKLQKISLSLRETSFKEKVMKECKHLFYDSKFLEKLDEHKSLLGFNNGVYDLDNLEFREGRPEDYISFSTNIDYINYDENDEYIKNVINFVSELQPEKDMQNYVLDFLCSCLQGHNPDEKFHIWTGSGCYLKGTNIMNYRGDIIKVEDIKVNDQLMGIDGTIRNVQRLYKGFDMMYKIELEDGYNYIVNSKHNIILKAIKSNDMVKKNDIISIRLCDYLELNNIHKNSLKWMKQDNLLMFNIIKLEQNYFYGFELDRDNLFLGEDYSVLSNSNGKSAIIDLFLKTIGEYGAIVSSTFLTTKRAASHQASPDLARTKGKRFAILNEPEGTDQIYVGRMKEMSGGDKLVARQLYKEPVEFLPQFKMLLLCNDLPHIPSNDGGTWRRIRVVPFEMKFVDEPKKSNERKIDRGLKEKLELWKESFMSLLIERYKIYKRNGLKEPVKVVKYTKDYQSDSDIYQQFIDEIIEITKDDKDILTIKEAFSDFKEWFRESHYEKKFPSKNEFIKEFEKRFDKPTKHGWRKMRSKKSDSSDDDIGSSLAKALS